VSEKAIRCGIFQINKPIQYASRCLKRNTHVIKKLKKYNHFSNVDEENDKTIRKYKDLEKIENNKEEEEKVIGKDRN